MLEAFNLLEGGFSPVVAVVGDVMLDRYLWGDVERISPEAPVPVLRVTGEEHRLGGAGSVAAMLAALGARVHLFSVTGRDPEADIIRQLLQQYQIQSDAVLTDPERTTTVKQRPLGRTNQRFPHVMMRIDREDRHPISPKLRQQLVEQLQELLPTIDLILISDYGKGVCTRELLRTITRAASDRPIPIIADPVRGVDFDNYTGCNLITPNRIEAAAATGITIATPADAIQAGKHLLRYQFEAVAVTLDKDGIVWVDRYGHSEHFPTRPREVADVAGAGDTVLSVLGFCLAAGADFRTCVQLANLAGGIQVERIGVVPISRRDLLAELHRQGLGQNEKIISVEQLLRKLAPLRARGCRVVMTNGCFDLLHPGHISSLQAAKALGDVLVVAINSDRAVKQLKGADRPIIDQQGRAEMLAALACVDYVVIFDNESVESLVAQIRPDCLVKGDQYNLNEVVGAQIVRSYGGTVATVPMKEGYSTTRLIAKIRGEQSEQLTASSKHAGKTAATNAS